MQRIPSWRHSRAAAPSILDVIDSPRGWVVLVILMVIWLVGALVGFTIVDYLLIPALLILLYNVFFSLRGRM